MIASCIKIPCHEVSQLLNAFKLPHREFSSSYWLGWDSHCSASFLRLLSSARNLSGAACPVISASSAAFESSSSSSSSVTPYFVFCKVYSKSKDKRRFSVAWMGDQLLYEYTWTKTFGIVFKQNSDLIVRVHFLRGTTCGFGAEIFNDAAHGAAGLVVSGKKGARTS